MQDKCSNLLKQIKNWIMYVYVYKGHFHSVENVISEFF
jgi:hypothetical protein